MAAPGAGGEGRILLVDDSPLVVDLLSEKLLERGFEIQTATSSRAALDLATEHAHPFDLFIVDVMMPEMNGFELAGKLRRHPRTRDASILLLTSLDTTDDIVSGLESGADDFLNKSVTDTELVARVRSLISLGMLRQRAAAQQEAVRGLLQPGSPSQPSDRRSRLMIVHTLPEAREKLASALRSDRVSTRTVNDAASARLALGAVPTDLVVASYAVALSGEDALLRRLPSLESPPSSLVIDETPSVDRRLAAFEAGADDYVSADAPTAELSARIATILRRRARYSSLELARDQAVLAAITDSLTGLFNRGFFQEALRNELARAQRHGHALVLILMDIDHFKAVNDDFGHPAGDAVLRQVGGRIRQALRITDVAARYGGEEFAVLLPQTFGDGTGVAERIRHNLEAAPMEVGDGTSIAISASFGVAHFPEHGHSLETLLAQADAALYVAKKAGRNRVITANELAEQDLRRGTVATAAPEVELLAALSQGPHSPLAQAQAQLEALSAKLKPGGGPFGELERLREAHAQLAQGLAEALARLSGKPKG